MAGPSNDFSPDQGPAIWLCKEDGHYPGELPGWLSEHERAALGNFTSPRREEYLLSRWLIRQALAGATSHPVASCWPVPGRPVRSESPEGWRLSLSHSLGLVACATSPDMPVGVDLEPIQRRPRWQAIARRWFSQREQEWLFEANDPMAFLKVWTLKEAWLKATGRGIAGNLQTLEVLAGYELVGDLPEPHWHACCFELPQCFVTLVWKQANAGVPDLHHVNAPRSLENLDGCEHRQLSVTAVLRQPILPANAERE